jgi:uncharacterized membrane protein YfcA
MEIHFNVSHLPKYRSRRLPRYMPRFSFFGAAFKKTNGDRSMTMRSFIKQYNKDYYGGGLMIFLGLAISLTGMHYEIGTLQRMGPGFFPVAIGVLMILTGAVIALSAKTAAPADADKTLEPEWRGWICIIAGIVAFIILGKHGGLLPATFAIVFISAMGDRQNTLKAAAILSLAMCAISAAVFWWALKMPFPLFAWS